MTPAELLDDKYKFDSQVDIIVPFHSQYSHVSNLVNSIFRLTKSNYYNLYIVDDCSKNADFMKQMEHAWSKRKERGTFRAEVHFIRNEEQLGFGGACRVAFEQGSSPYVCVVQSDCVIKDSNWLKRLGTSLWQMKQQNVRMISPKLTNITGGAQAQQAQFDEVGVFVKEDDAALNDEFISLACFMAHRELFKRIGGFIKEYPLGNYEDEELFLRMKHYGFRQGVCGSTFVEHIGNETFKEIMRVNPNEFRRIYDENYQRCIEDVQKLSVVKK